MDDGVHLLARVNQRRGATTSSRHGNSHLSPKFQRTRDKNVQRLPGLCAVANVRSLVSCCRPLLALSVVDENGENHKMLVPPGPGQAKAFSRTPAGHGARWHQVPHVTIVFRSFPTVARPRSTPVSRIPNRLAIGQDYAARSWVRSGGPRMTTLPPALVP